MTKQYVIKRYVIADNKAIVDTETMTPNGIPTKIFVAEDPFEANKICNELNEQDQKTKAIEKLLDNELKKAFNNRINHDDYAKDAELAEYFKGYHCGVGDLKKKIRHILFNE